VDDFATNRLIQRISEDSDALESTIRESLSEPARLAALDKTGLMDGKPHAVLDGVASLTAEALAVPHAAVSLLDGQREFLVGTSAALAPEQRWRPAELSICKYTVVSGIPFVVDDTRRHPLLASLPSVVGREVGAYAGIPLFSTDDHAVGTLHVWFNRSHLWTSGQVIVLQDMADIASAKVSRRPI
jgi:GAF domain-containing protein